MSAGPNSCFSALFSQPQELQDKRSRRTVTICEEEKQGKTVTNPPIQKISEMYDTVLFLFLYLSNPLPLADPHLSAREISENQWGFLGATANGHDDSPRLVPTTLPRISWKSFEYYSPARDVLWRMCTFSVSSMEYVWASVGAKRNHSNQRKLAALRQATSCE